MLPSLLSVPHLRFVWNKEAPHPPRGGGLIEDLWYNYIYSESIYHWINFSEKRLLNMIFCPYNILIPQYQNKRRDWEGLRKHFLAFMIWK